MATADCNTCVLSNTVKPYQLHIILCTSKSPAEWADRVENDPLVGMVNRVVKDFSTGEHSLQPIICHNIW